jgi:hypothetical protein
LNFNIFHLYLKLFLREFLFLKSTKIKKFQVLKSIEDDLIDPVAELRHVGVDQIVVQVTNPLIFPIYYSTLSDSSRNNSDQFPQSANFQDQSAARVA